MDTKRFTRFLAGALLVLAVALQSGTSLVGEEYKLNTGGQILTVLLITSGFLLALWHRVFYQISEVDVSVDKQCDTSDPLVGVDYYRSLSLAARQLAQSLYNRSGVYLIVGVGLAILGIGVFAVLLSGISISMMNGGLSQSVLWGLLITSQLPKAAMFLLIELIAFFFLRQSRAAMDEFRYYEAIARGREEVLAALTSGEAGVRMSDLIEKGLYFTHGDKLSSGETTEIVEMRKLEKSEVEVLSRIVEAIGSRVK